MLKSRLHKSQFPARLFQEPKSGCTQKRRDAKNQHSFLCANFASSRLCVRFFSAILPLLLTSCSPRIPHTLVSDYAQRRPMAIAVMPVSNDTGGRLRAPSTAGALQSMLRKLLSDRHGTDKADVLTAFQLQISTKLSEKGYRPLPLQVLDARLASLAQEESLDPRRLKAALQADAILYSSLSVWDTQYWRTLHAIVMEVQFTLVAIDTGETLWQGEQEKQSVTIRDLQKSQDYRFYVEKVVNRVFSTLP